MLTIRPAQLDALQAHSEGEFVARACRYLGDECPETYGALPPEARQARVRRVIESARGYGLTRERAVICYARVEELLGDDFAANPGFDWAPRLLADAKYDQTFRAKLALSFAGEIRDAEAGGHHHG